MVVKKIRKCPKCGQEYSAWRVSCLTCGGILQLVEREQTETEKETLRGVESGEEDDDFLITKWVGEELPEHWLRSYLKRITIAPLFFIIILGGIAVIIGLVRGHNGNLIGLTFGIMFGIGVLYFLLAAIMCADETPLRKYRLIREISGLFRWLYKHTPTPGGKRK